MDLTHLNSDGRPRMVDISSKEESVRVAIAEGRVYLKEETIERIRTGPLRKGDVLYAAQLAGILAAKKTSEIIPMCHNILIDSVDLSFEFEKNSSEIVITAEVKTTGKTGVEMEALTAVSATALTIYDMCKAIDKNIEIRNIKLKLKTGGKSDYGQNCLNKH